MSETVTRAGVHTKKGTSMIKGKGRIHQRDVVMGHHGANLPKKIVKARHLLVS